LKSEPIFFTLAEKAYEIVDIGGGGLAFRNTGFAAGQRVEIELEIPGFAPLIRTGLEVRSICENNICHCAFAGISEEDVEKIHQYMLEKQKEMVRSKKTARTIP